MPNTTPPYITYPYQDQDENMHPAINWPPYPPVCLPHPSVRRKAAHSDSTIERWESVIPIIIRSAIILLDKMTRRTKTSRNEMRVKWVLVDRRRTTAKRRVCVCFVVVEVIEKKFNLSFSLSRTKNGYAMRPPPPRWHYEREVLTFNGIHTHTHTHTYIHIEPSSVCFFVFSFFPPSSSSPPAAHSLNSNYSRPSLLCSFRERHIW